MGMRVRSDSQWHPVGRNVLHCELSIWKFRCERALTLLCLFSDEGSSLEYGNEDEYPAGDEGHGGTGREVEVVGEVEA